MKVFCYVGSNAVESSGYALMQKVKRQLEYLQVETYFYQERDINIQLCRGCGKCFQEGKCLLERQDDLTILKQQMKRSDIILWVSPVYAVNVSGAMKNYIDRLAHWLHTMELVGKCGIVISVSSNSGLEFTSYYMKRIMESMGCYVIKEYKLRMLDEWNEQEVVSDIVHSIQLGLEIRKQGVYTESMEESYKMLKQSFGNLEENEKSSNAYEINYWHCIKKLGLDTLKQYIEWKEKENGI